MKTLKKISGSILIKGLFGLLVIICTSQSSFSQNVGISASGSQPNTSAGLDVDFADKGLLIPRVALTGTSNAAPLAAHVAGMMVYNTATVGNVTSGFYFNNGSKWIALSGGGVSQMTSAERLAIVTPPIGIEVFDLTANIKLFYNGSRWLEVGGDPIGTIKAWHKSKTATPALAWGWVECNGQTLSDSESPYNGQIIENLNSQVYAGGRGYYLRGGLQSGSFNGSTYWTDNGTSYAPYATGTRYYGGGYGNYVELDSNASGQHNYNSTVLGTDRKFQVAAMTVVYIMRVK